MTEESAAASEIHDVGHASLNTEKEEEDVRKNLVKVEAMSKEEATPVKEDTGKHRSNRRLTRSLEKGEEKTTTTTTTTTTGTTSVRGGKEEEKKKKKKKRPPGRPPLSSKMDSSNLKRKVPPPPLPLPPGPSSNGESVAPGLGNKRRRSARNTSSGGGGGTESLNDCYCWICHKEGEVICCETCPRVFHLRCIQLEMAPTEDWVCPECVLIMTAENMDTRSRAMRLLTVDQLCSLLKHALSRVRTLSGIDPFTRPVDPAQFPAYRDYVTCPMDLQTLEKNVRKKQYGSTEAFLADLKWILHNCIIFNTSGSKLTAIAKQLIKVSKHEMQEIENCPDCYMNAHTKKDSWFVAACRIPHLLVWAKLKGFPFWPGKAMRVNSEENVDVRFFGAHDRAWIPVKDVYLYSLEPPVPMKNKKRGNLEGCVQEVELYVKKITEKFGKFEHAPFKTQLDFKKEEEQIKTLYPMCNLPFELGPVRTRVRTFSFSGSERSHSGTPTPCEEELSKSENEGDKTSQSARDSAIMPLSEKQELNTRTEEEDSKLELEDDDEGEEEDDEDNAEEEEEVDDVEPETVERPLKSSVDKKEVIMSSDRVAASPPCEVSSTTTTASDTTSSSKKPSNESQAPKSLEVANKPEPKLAVIAETSETVIIEGDDEEEEEEIDDDEEAIAVDEEIDDVEPEVELKSPKLEQDQAAPSVPKEPEDIKVKTQEAEKEPISDKKEAETEKDKKEEKSSEIPDAEAPQKSPELSTSKDEEEIDDVEPEAEVMDEEEEEINDAEDEEINDAEVEPDKPSTAKVPEETTSEKPMETSTAAEIAAQKEGLDTSRLLASGVSVTVKSTPSAEQPSLSKKRKPSVEFPSTTGNGDRAEEPVSKKVMVEDKIAKTVDGVGPEISLGSDISVTVVQKKKIPTPPRITVKKESELLAESRRIPPRDIVHVSKAKKNFSSNTQKKNIDDSSEGNDKNPPDPIVTISKVQALVSGVPNSKKDVSTMRNTPPLCNQQQPTRKASSVVPTSSPSSIAHPPRSTPSSGPLTGMLNSSRMIPPPPHPQSSRSRTLSQNSMMRMAISNSPGGHPMGMPSLHPRPQGLLSAPPPLPSAAGPVSEQLNRVAGKLVDYMRLSLEELFREMAGAGSPEATIKALQLEMEKNQWRHQQELAETRHNTELKFQEFQHAMEAEKQKALSDLKKQMELEKQKAVSDAKKKQWCAHCGKEAIFYCCWNTSYCDYPCQQAHWPSHMSTCAQNQTNNDDDGGNAATSSDHHPTQPSPMDHVDHGAGSHFLSNSTGSGRSQTNGMMPPASRGMQPMMLPFGPAGINPRLMSQMGLRFCPPPHPSGPPRGVLSSHLRFPGNYFM